MIMAMTAPCQYVQLPYDHGHDAPSQYDQLPYDQVNDGPCQYVQLSYGYDGHDSPLSVCPTTIYDHSHDSPL
jgi:hypothetical protein